MEGKKINPFLKFAIWMVVIIIMVAVGFVKTNNENHWLDDLDTTESSREASSENTSKEASFQSMREALSSNNYDFVFTINNDFKYTFTGRRCNELETGFKETKDGIIKYIINNDKKTYKIVNDENEEISDLYTGFDSSYLDINSLFSNLKNIIYSVIEDSAGNTYIYDMNDYKVEFKTNNIEITSIIITTENTTYNLEFSNIGKCAKIDFNN